MREASSFCDSALEAIEPYLEGDLAARQTEAFEAHIAACRSCRQEFVLARRILGGLRELPEFACPSTVDLELSTRRRELGPSPPRSLDGRRLAAAAALVLALLGGAVIYRSSTPPNAEVELARAERDARIALTVLDSINRRATVSLRDKVLKEQVFEASGRAVDRIVNDRGL